MPPQINDRQRDALVRLARGADSEYWLHRYGVRLATLRALARRGLAVAHCYRWQITDAGRSALRAK